MSTRRATPPDLGPAGVETWESVARCFRLEDHEAKILHEAAHTADLIAELAADVEREGRTAVTASGSPKLHPAVTEVRQQRIALGKLIASLRLPEAPGSGGRPQRRSQFRGPYGPKAVS